ncbi:uncharacterized protein LOC128679369 [Plodia interpunctella]|uniref:uncharacterized protein LOC128679369 n=1 Tax=Plodia interpunctella TaxID=58824 RepID=UPI002368EAF7|nr:uncharacterized protein LOC128679369 [Plodia interpunctella]
MDSSSSISSEEFVFKVKNEMLDQLVKTEQEELSCVLCIKPHLDNFVIYNTELTASGVTVYTFFTKFAKAGLGFSPHGYICKTCLNLVNELEELQIQYKKLKTVFQTLIGKNPLFELTPLFEENEVGKDIVKNEPCSDINEDSQIEDNVSISKKRKCDSEKNDNYWGKNPEKTEQLIEIVRNYAALYDPSHAQYRKNKTKTKIWDSIANVMGEEDGETVKAEWENLKESYINCLKANRPDADYATTDERYKSWPWRNQMSFLRLFVDCLIAPVIRETEIVNSNGSFNQPNAFSHGEEINDYVNNRTIADYDETSLIFLGYAKIVNKMSFQLQAKLKFEFAKLMMDAEIQSANEKQDRGSALNTMTVAAQDRPVIIATQEVAIEESQQFAIICAPPLNIPAGNNISRKEIKRTKAAAAEAAATTATEKERLIEVVKNYAVLYDNTLSGYRNDKKKNKIWDNIAQVIGEKDGETVKLKWKNLVDSYRIFLRSNQGVEQVDGPRSLPWVNQMQFLRPFVECLGNPVTSESDTENS